ncbi:choice-of-anchor Q domain-containing protein, partial [Pedobacter sp. ASV28]|uniref:choice-of-anchor Q domain-containing protein n=1 Tax=Pedobacter sp. ASV28 TaxID=2795123 RepID=UPI0018EDD16B
MTKFIFFIFLLVLLSFSVRAQTPDANGNVYVKPLAAGNGNGSSWSNATSNLQGAINAVGAKQIWVAEGMYQSASGTSFNMKNGVAVYGGFKGLDTELILAQRNSKLNVTILKGNGTRVIYNLGLNATAILDGFTITDGVLSGNASNVYGAGIYNDSSSPTISNCIISNNIVTGTGAIAKGGGMANTSGSPILTNCVFMGNKTDYQGGAIYNENAVPVIRNCFFVNNESLGTDGNSGGGAIFNTGINTYNSIKNCVFYGNKASYGTAIRNSFTANKDQAIVNCTFYGNTQNTSSATLARTLYSNFSTLTITNCIIWSNYGTTAIYKQNGADPIYQYSLVQGNNVTTNNNLDASNATNAPQFVNITNIAGIVGADGFYGTADDGLALQATSPLLNKGSNVPVDNDFDIVGNTRIRNNTVDLGAYEYQIGNIIPNIVPSAMQI